MNDIKFRAWNIKENKYIEIIGFYMFNSSITLWFLDSQGLPNYKSYHVNSIILEQYTGLKNRYGDVYQGDIYEWCGLVFPITIDDYHGYRFMFGEDQLVRAYIENGKYIGNIHESTP